MDEIHQIKIGDKKVKLYAEYNLKGVLVGDNETVFARKTITQVNKSRKQTRYEICYNTYGPEAGQPFNPQSQHTNLFSQGYDKKLGRSRLELRFVPGNIFEMYLRFLQTGNQAILRELERVQ